MNAPFQSNPFSAAGPEASRPRFSPPKLKFPKTEKQNIFYMKRESHPSVLEIKLWRLQIKAVKALPE
ncbi:unnamed protein product, partial [Brenthis ino]